MFLKNKNINFKIRRSKVTDYAALKVLRSMCILIVILLFFPKKTISSKPSLPWMTQEIQRNIRKRDSLFQKYKKNKTPKDREVFIQMRHQVRHKLNLANNQYLEDILGISKTEDDAEPGKSSLSAKKLYTMLNRSKNDSRGVSSLSRDGKLYTENKDKANILNCQFQSVFTPKTPLALSSLAQIAVQDLVDTGKLDTRSVPAKI